MRSRDYTQEIGISPTRQRVPAVIGFVVLAIVVVAAIWFVRKVESYQPVTQAEADHPVAVKVSRR